ncbi:MAG: aminotransferase class V-fold PLP-dependent enzyme [Coprococcus sp.]
MAERSGGSFSGKERCPIVTFNLGEYDSGEVSDALLTDYGIATRSGGHCAPLMHEALGTREQGSVRFSFSHYNTEEEVAFAVKCNPGTCLSVGKATVSKVATEKEKDNT